MKTNTALALGGSLLGLAACQQDVPAPASPPTHPIVVAGFAPPTTGVEVNSPASFQNTSQNALTYKWDFGDGSTEKTTTPTHIYSKVGNYTVTLWAYGANRDSSIFNLGITVSEYNIFAHSTTKITGTYDFILTTTVNYPLAPTTSQSKGTLTVVRDLTNIIITTPEFVSPCTYKPGALPPAPYQFKYTDYNLAGAASFYPTGDSLQFTIDQRVSAGGSKLYFYRAYRRP